MNENIPEKAPMCGTWAQPTLCRTRRRYMQLARKYTTSATHPIIANTPRGETLVDACGGGTVGHAWFVRISNMYTQSNGAERKLNEGCTISR